MANILDQLVADADEEREALGDQLGKVGKLALDLEVAEADLKLAEDNLRAAEERYNTIAGEDLPNALTEAELAGIETKSGRALSLKAWLSAKDTEAGREWLIANGYGDLVKTTVTVSFDRGNLEDAEALAATLTRDGYHGVQVATGVHNSTLVAQLKRLVEKAAPVPLDLFETHMGTVAVLDKAPKRRYKKR